MVTLRRRSYDYSIPRRPFPIGRPLEQFISSRVQHIRL